ncbi:MAG TPA: DUF6125 family protein [Bacteroidales bacterium]|nr:DUF6125 family protein [Bacteroidales bacterium]
MRVIFDIFHRTIMHHAMWFEEVSRQHGRDKAYQLLDQVLLKSTQIQLKRISKALDIPMNGEFPDPWMDIATEKLDALTEAAAVNWLANDGVWFQALEFDKDMPQAKLCNDSTWASFSPFEAWAVKRLLNLGDNPGLEGLKKALQFRCYGFINKQAFVNETPTSFVYMMNDCRVQSARKRKGLDDYPCKSAGIMEYYRFAEIIDSRIKTEVITCPPDLHPETHYCAWKFTLEL